jgi:hypothetical protein
MSENGIPLRRKSGPGACPAADHGPPVLPGLAAAGRGPVGDMGPLGGPGLVV